MSDVKNMLRESMVEGELIEMTLSNVRKKSLATFTKVTVRPVEIKGAYLIQLAYHYDEKVMHENLPLTEALPVIQKMMEGYFKQAMVHTSKQDYHVLVSKKGDTKILTKKPTKVLKNFSHNIKKQYVLEEGIPHDFLVALEIMSPEGLVYKRMYHKFRQINRYLEILEDAIKTVAFDETIRVVDFGCGKAYLTFAMYYYLHVIKKKPVEIVGLDLKADVIQSLKQIAHQLKYTDLIFQQGDIQHFKWDKRPDIVVSLHACDTATDEAIAKAIEWDAKVIMAVPCCQHEAYTQIGQSGQNIILKHGILKERLAALSTDAIRATLMELVGYQTIVMEFIDLEHTPKNLMIRGVKGKRGDQAQFDDYKAFTAYWQLKPRLEVLLEDKLHDHKANR